MLAEHRAEPPLASEGEAGKYHRNGSSPKKVSMTGCELHLEVPLDRLSSFEAS